MQPISNSSNYPITTFLPEPTIALPPPELTLIEYKNELFRKWREADPQTAPRLFIKFIELLRNSGQLISAMDWIRRELKRDPDNVEILLVEAKIFFEWHHPEKSKEILRKIISLDPKHSEAAFYYLLALHREENSVEFIAWQEKHYGHVNQELGRNAQNIDDASLKDLILLKSLLSTADREFLELLLASPNVLPFEQLLEYLALNYTAETHAAILNCLETLSDQNPFSIDILLMKGMIYQTSHAFEKAEAVWEKLISLGRGDRLEYRSLCFSQFAKERVFILLQTCSEHPLDLLKKLATVFLTLEELLLAQSAYRHVLAKDIVHPLWWSRYAYTSYFIERGANFDKALSDLQYICSVDPKNQEVWFRHVFILYSGGRYEEAFKHIPKLRSGKDALHLKGLIYTQRRDYPEAVKAFQEASKYDPKDPLLHMKCGIAYSFLNNPDLCRAEFRKAIELNPYDSALYLNFATSLDLLKPRATIPEMIHLLDSAIEEDPALAHAYEMRSHLRAQLKDFIGALKDCRRYLELKPNSKKGYRHLGTLHVEFSDYQSAFSAYKKHLSFPQNSLDTKAIKSSISCLIKLGKKEEAADMIGLYEKVCPMPPNWIWFRSRILLLEGQTNEAHRLLSSALKQIDKTHADYPQILACHEIAKKILNPSPKVYPRKLRNPGIGIAHHDKPLRVNQKLLKLWKLYTETDGTPALKGLFCKSPENFSEAFYDLTFDRQIPTLDFPCMTPSELRARLYDEIQNFNYLLIHPHPDGRKACIMSLFVISSTYNKLLIVEQKLIADLVKTRKQLPRPRPDQAKAYAIYIRFQRYLAGITYLSPSIPPLTRYTSPDAVSLSKCIDYAEQITKKRASTNCKSM